MDRGYLDFARLYQLHQSRAFFVIRAKGNLQCRRRYSHPIDPTTGVRSDQTIVLTGPKGRIAPDVGQDTEDILLSLGMSWEDIGTLKEAKVIS